MLSIPDHNRADVRAVSPSDAIPIPRRARLSLSLQESEFLRAWLDAHERYADLPIAEQERRALLMAGYEISPLSPEQLVNLRRSIHRKIDRAIDMAGALSEIGMGRLPWIRLIYDMSQAMRRHPGGVEVPDWKYRAVAAKLWGLALGVFSQAPQGEGASINLHLGAQSGPDGRVEVAARLEMPRRVPVEIPEPPEAPIPYEDTPARQAAEAHYRAARLALGELT